jgi:hypothetical protein
MAERTRGIVLVQIVLTLTAFEFFGPIVRDLNASHALNPSWVGHARLHLVWLLGFMLLSGLANLYLIWFRRPFDVRNLWLSAGWQSCNLGGFWIASLSAPGYGGLVTVPGEHVHLFGWDENVVVFAVLSLLMAVALLVLQGRAVREAAHASR